jgi:CspA family cold shock protein
MVKWFNAEKGFGFVAVVGGSEAFLHIRQLEVAGQSSVPEGARVKVRIGQGQKGPEVTEVIEVDISTAQVTSTNTRQSTPRSSSTQQLGVGATTECVGSVKMYNRDKGFGFVGQDDGGKDVFVHATTLGRGGLSEVLLTYGQSITFGPILMRRVQTLESEAMRLTQDSNPAGPFGAAIESKNSK